MKNIIVFFALLMVRTLHGQPLPSRDGDFRWHWQEGRGMQFQSILPPLAQKAGAPPAFYDHYWEFGDGSYSLEKEPVHPYRKEGTYEVFYMATGKYDNGKAPRSRKKSVQSPAAGEPKNAVAEHSLQKQHLRMQAVRNPRAEEEFVCILTYRNLTPVEQSGRLLFFFNERAWPAAHFDWLEARIHHGEVAEELLSYTPIPFSDSDFLADLQPSPLHDYLALRPPFKNPHHFERLNQQYRNFKAWRFKALQAGEQRHLFVSLMARPNMIKDTSALIYLSGLYESDDGRVSERFDLELEIVASHDPNTMAVSKRRMGFRRVKNKHLDYKIQFQNTGEGPASTVKISTPIPQGLSAQRLYLLDFQPLCAICPKKEAPYSCLDTQILKNELVFTFKNIYLPGTRQQDTNDRDSTKGWIKYRIHPDRQVRKLPLNTYASIVFDKNPPVVTNHASTHFKTGLSIAPAVGRDLDKGNSHLSVGLLLAPYKPWRSFLQGEVWQHFRQADATSTSYQKDTSWFKAIILANGVINEAKIDSSYREVRVRRTTYFPDLSFALMPGYHLNDWLSLGAGAQFSLTWQRTEEEITFARSVRAFNLSTKEEMKHLSKDYPAQKELLQTSRSTEWDWRLFAHVFVGRVRSGPSVGLRYFVPLGSDREGRWFAFVTWRF
ncbi:MAG: PKD domain-containing protein [Saprospiraceae bacterium]|nr:PKD domain-containing protein [Saprospiraceae bacterium]MDW8231001.1 PKD domain-containing protein [Saprospiraceae bacterium]